MIIADIIYKNSNIISIDFKEPDPNTNPQRKHIIRVHNQLHPHPKTHTISTTQQYLPTFAIVLQYLYNLLRLQCSNLDRESLECVLCWNVVLYRILELLLTEC